MTHPADPAAFLRSLYDAAVATADPRHCVPPHLTDVPATGRIVVVGAGKASAAMARAVEVTAAEQGWADRLSGLAVTRYGHAVPCARIEIVEAAHPVPDRAGYEAAQRILDLARGAGEGDLVLCLISGGGSALLALPAPGISMADKQAVNAALLACGAPIDAMNCVRKHMSAIKGGQLAVAAAPARIVTLLISDVPGDEPAVIASGPTVPDPTTFADALDIVSRYGIELPDAVRARFEAGDDETPKPDNMAFANARAIIVARPMVALEAAARLARQAGVMAQILGDAIEGEARDVGHEQAEIALAAAAGGNRAPRVLLSGGETTVTLAGTGGRGGRNAEYQLGMALSLQGHPRIWTLACDTDGIDGTEVNAGVLVTPDTLARAAAIGLDPAAMLAQHETYTLFAALDDLVVTGPTLTNVNDFRAIFIGANDKGATAGHG